MEENITNFFLSLYKYITHIINRVMLTNALRILVKNLVKKSFYGKKKINVSIAFFISYKNDVKIFF